jgi:hypothetical protein
LCLQQQLQPRWLTALLPQLQGRPPQAAASAVQVARQLAGPLLAATQPWRQQAVVLPGWKQLQRLSPLMKTA